MTPVLPNRDDFLPNTRNYALACVDYVDRLHESGEVRVGATPEPLTAGPAGFRWRFKEGRDRKWRYSERDPRGDHSVIDFEPLYLALEGEVSRTEPALTDALRDVKAERTRQVSVEGWTPEHDDHHTTGDLAKVAAFYAVAGLRLTGTVPDGWPWDEDWWKPKDSRSNLVKAGALILAEIERLDRALVATKGESSNSL